MRTKIFFGFTLLFSILNIYDASAQCTLTASDDTLWICEGDCADLVSSGGCPTYMMNNDFNNMTIGTGWTANCAPMFNNPCIAPQAGSATYLWVGNASNFPRELVTIAYPVTTDCRICFDMAYATQGAASPCEGPDLTTEGVHLQYWNGAAWVDINYWDPNGGYDPIMTSWQNYCEDIPVNGNIQFRWFQDVTSGNDYDHWGLDNVQIFCPPPTQTQWWAELNGTVVDTGFTATVCPTITTTYVAHIDDSTGNHATDTTVVFVFPTPTLSIDNLNGSYCVSEPAFALQGSPAGGEFSGNGVVNGIFDPALAGTGTHTITYHIYNIANYTISGVHILFEDDFSTDMGWTGYGSGGWTRGSAVASAGCSGSQDPSLDNTPTADNFIIGNYLGACYPNSMASTYWLTSPVIDCSGMINCAIDMWSHSGCESNSFDHMYIDVYNGVTWSNVFSNSGSYSESTWTNLNYNVSAAADNNPNFRVRFGMGSTDGSVTYKGWNIDDFKITGIGDVNVIDTLCDFTTTQNTVVFAAPNPDFTFVDSVCVYSNTTIQYTGNASAGANYSWNFSGGTIVSGSGQGPFQVYWTSANTYALTLSVDENGCINDTTFYITVLPANSPFCCVLPTPDAGPADSTCSLSYTMQAAASGIPGAWVVSSGPAGSTANFANATANNSAVTVDTYGVYVFSWTEGYSPTCSASDSVMIAFYPDPVFDFTNINLLCNNICQGSITVNPLGTTDLPYSYLWDSNAGNQTSVTATNLCAGPFTVTVTNVHGCTDFSSSTLTEPPLLTASAVISSNYNGEDVSCYGSTDGSANLTVTGGTTNYSYSWTGPAGFTSAIEDISGIGAGTYNVVVTDANLCTATSGVTLTQPTQVSVSTSMTQVSCFGYSDGTATATPSGGTGVISYLWNDLSSQTTPTATGLAGGPYNIVVTDANGCTAGGSITVTQPASPVSLTISGTQNISCFNGSDGYVNITVAGGSGGFTYNWDSGQTSEDLNNVQAGTYCVVASDMFGCSVSDCATLTEPTQLLSSISSVDASCYGGHDGSVSVTASGGTQPYFYNWSNGMSGPSIMNVESGNYSVIVTDNNGCTTSNSAVVEEPSEIVISASSDIWICIGQTTQLNAAAVGGSPGYTFTWSTGTQASSISVSPTVTQQYSVQAEDAIGCYSNTDYVTVFVYKPITVEVSISETEICPGDPVFIYANATGGNGNYTYALTGGQQIWPPYTDYPSESTSYTVTASDNCGSPTDQGTVNVEVMPLPPISFAPDTVQGCEPLTVHFIENSPDVGQNYVWDFDDPNSYNTSSKKNPTHTFEYDGVYDITLTVTSADGCVITDVVEDLITVWPRPEAGFIPDPDVASVIKPIIFFQNTSNGGFDYHWMFGDGDSSLTIHPYHTYASVPGTYLVELIVTSDKGCRDTIYDEVMIRDEYTFYAPNAFSPDGNGQNDRFFVTGHGIDEGEFLLIIYDRWGEEIYKSEDISEGWDGKAKNGNKECKVGTYTWLAVFKDFQGIEHQETGMVTIIR